MESKQLYICIFYDLLTGMHLRHLAFFLRLFTANRTFTNFAFKQWIILGTGPSKIFTRKNLSNINEQKCNH